MRGRIIVLGFILVLGFYACYTGYLYYQMRKDYQQKYGQFYFLAGWTQDPRSEKIIGLKSRWLGSSALFLGSWPLTFLILRSIRSEQDG